jgi:hypothetical protein
MDSRDVTAEQARVIGQWVDTAVQRLTRLQRRMEVRGFPQTDKLYVQVACARQALARLNGALSFYNNPTHSR